MSTVSIFGAFTILASVRTKLCIFQKIRSRKRKTTIKTEEQSLTPQLWRKSSHAGSWVSVVRRRWWASWDIGHALVPRVSQLHISVGGFGGVGEELGSLCSPPPFLRLRQILLISRRKDEHEGGICWGAVGAGPTTLAKASSVCRLCSLIIVVVS